MRNLVCLFCALATWLIATGATAAEPGFRSEWLYPGPDGKLVYKTTLTGDKIMDFSHAGYMGGGVALPVVAVKRTLEPSKDGADDTAAIQAALKAMEELPLEEGFRGAIQLGPGVFTCSGTITISASGIVLRGSGNGAKPGPRTTLKLSGKPHNGIAVRGSGGGDTAEFTATQTSITDAYVPSGAISFSVADTAGFAAGDTISIRRPVTAAWIKFMGMDNMVRDGKAQTWLRAGSTSDAERRIAAIAGKTITLDVPLSDSFDSKYLNPPGTAVVKIKLSALVTKVGIENLHIECPPQAISHTQPHFTALRINAQDSWVRDVAIDETMDSVGVSGRRITLERVSVRRKALHEGSSRPAEFAPNGSQVLMNRCSVHADNIWFVAMGSGVSGPVAIVNCDFQGRSRAESHQRWSTGVLFDNCRAPNGGIELRNRGAMGSGHGWSMGWGVIWNCEATDYIIQNPPGAANWLIGSKGSSKLAARPFETRPNLPAGIVDSSGKPVAPRSLYMAQLAERLGPQALKNIGEGK